MCFLFLSSEVRLFIFISVIVLIVCFLLSIILLREIRDKKLLKSVTEKSRGTVSEHELILKLLKYGVSPISIFHDLYFKKSNGQFFQIDLVLVTKIGLIVLEVKDYSGWIFGSGKNPEWTQVLAYGREKYRFYNPIMQNNRHIIELKKIKQFNNLPIYSIVVFSGDSVLKNINHVPEGSFIVKYERILEVITILEDSRDHIHYLNKEEILQTLKEAVLNGGDKETQKNHIRNVEELLGKNRIFD